MSFEFRWNKWNLDKIAKHGVDPLEAERVVNGANCGYPRKAGNKKLMVIGRGQGDRMIQVIYVTDEDGCSESDTLGIAMKMPPSDSVPSRAILKPTLIIIGVLLVPLVIFASLHWTESVYDKSACKTNLEQIGRAVALYADENHGVYPDSFQTILRHEPISSSAFICPRTMTSPATGPTTRDTADNMTAEHISYVYRGDGLTKSTANPGAVIAYEPLSNHGDGLHVLYGDGHVDWIPAANAAAFLATVQPAGPGPASRP
jgi:uncharacterized DUF497 family protein